MKSSENRAAVDAYVAAFPAKVRKVLQKVRETIRRAAPMAEERMSYKMPTFFQDGVIVHFGAFKEHIGLYPPVRAPELQAPIAPYRGEKGNLRFPLDEPIPHGLIADIVKSRLESRSGKGSKRKREVKAKRVSKTPISTRNRVRRPHPSTSSG